jgi:triosephosphate isomerase
MQSIIANKPLILVNFKAITGIAAIRLAEKVNDASNLLAADYTIAIALQPDDVYGVSRNINLLVFIHDIFSKTQLHEKIGAGFVGIENTSGLLINHPENINSETTLYKNFCCAKQNNLKVIIASTNIQDAISLNEKYSPDYIAIENASLIGKNISISKECPEVIESAILNIPNKILFGAGVRGLDDIDHILKCGGAGVLVSSLVIKASDPTRALVELLRSNEKSTKDRSVQY